MVPENEFGQPIGAALPGWTKRPLPLKAAIEGRFCRIEPVDAARHAAQLQEAFAGAPLSVWTYLPDYMGPHRTIAAWQAWLEEASASADPLWHAILDPSSGKAIGMAAYLRIDANSGSIEVGGLMYSPQLQRKPASTEAMYLMMRRAFDELGYRRYEWKCDSLNAPSRAAALRLGFTYEGIFRQHMVYRGRSRDSAWFSIIDTEWPKLRAMFEGWLRPDNFDAEGRQKAGLSSFR
jgi:RimJ/RimL family protein N-acetyltransferase